MIEPHSGIFFGADQSSARIGFLFPGQGSPSYKDGGAWGRRFNFLEPGDIDSALKAAFEIGDDRLQKKARGQVVPDSFTHGTSEQRLHWFKKGFESGARRQGNTFAAGSP